MDFEALSQNFCSRFLVSDSHSLHRNREHGFGGLPFSFPRFLAEFFQFLRLNGLFANGDKLGDIQSLLALKLLRPRLSLSAWTLRVQWALFTEIFTGITSNFSHLYSKRADELTQLLISRFDGHRDYWKVEMIWSSLRFTSTWQYDGTRGWGTLLFREPLSIWIIISIGVNSGHLARLKLLAFRSQLRYFQSFPMRNYAGCNLF